jgi:MIZ/SP-RING zinc finger
VQTSHATTIGRMSGVREALAKFTDSSTTFRALVDLLRSAGVIVPTVIASTSVSPARQFILDYPGFSASVHPDPAVLAALPRTELDNLSWVFGVNRQGRKADVARRIILLLRAPLNASLKRKQTRSLMSVPHNMSATIPPSAATYSNALTDTELYRMLASQIDGAPMATASAAGLLPQPQHLRASESTGPLVRRGSMRRSSSVTNAGASTAPTASVTGRRGHSAVYSILDRYQFLEPENPFNIPVSPPLGETIRFVVFSAEQLSRGVEPAITFRTPTPRGDETGVDVQVHLRCLRVENNKQPSTWLQSWPFPAAARINGHNLTINQALRYTSGKLAGLDAATNISAFLRKYKADPNPDQTSNHVVLRRHASTASSAPGTYVMFVQEIGVHSAEVMKIQIVAQSKAYWHEHYEKYRAKQARKILEAAARSVEGTEDQQLGDSDLSNFELARRGVVQFMNADGLCSSSMKVSLCCPLSLNRMRVPVKGRKCLHVQCFDLEDFLMYTRRSPKFLCPVCNKPNALPSDLVVSPYIERALELFSCDEVEVGSDGSLTAVVAQRNGVQSDDEDDDDPGEDGRSEDVARSNPGEQGSGCGERGHPPPANVVDLTLSDDEDGPAERRVSSLRTTAQTHIVPFAASAANPIPRGVAERLIAAVNCTARYETAAAVAFTRDNGVRSNDTGPALDYLGAPGVRNIDTGPAIDHLGMPGIPENNIFDDLVPPGTNAAWGCDVIALDSD